METEKKNTGIYHIVMCSIDRQDLFREDEDYWMFIQMLGEMQVTIGHPERRIAHLYAYCLAKSHVHLLIRETGRSVDDTIESLNYAYTNYFNAKYKSQSEIFEPYKSEPCNDYDYFVVLLRYIHQHPVKAKQVNEPNEYRYSSWANDYYGLAKFKACYIEPVIKRISFRELEQLINVPLFKTHGCIDVGRKKKMNSK